MKQVIIIVISLFISYVKVKAQQSSSYQPKIMVIPFVKNGEDMRTVLDNNVSKRIAITKVKEAFDNMGYPTVDFIGKLKAANDDQIFTSNNQSDIKSKIIEFSGSDVYVEVDINEEKSNTGNSVSTILSSYETANGNSLANAVGSSGKFYSDDIDKLTTRAVNMCIEDFINTIKYRFSKIENEGHSVLVTFSFNNNSSMNMSSNVGNDGLSISDVIENWISQHSVNGNYHIQGVTNLKMIFDDIKIPFKDSNGNNYTSNKYALLIFDFLKSISLSPSKDVKGSTIYITLN